APYIVGTLGQKVNYHLGFGVAAIGMALGLLVFLLTAKKHLPAESYRPKNPVTKEESEALALRIAGIVVLMALCFIVFKAVGVLDIHFFVNCITILAIILPIVYFIVMLSSKKTTGIERSRIRAYIFLFIASVFFWI